MTITSRGAVAPTSDQRRVAGGDVGGGRRAARHRPRSMRSSTSVADHAAVVGRDRCRRPGRSPAAGHHRHHGRRRTSGWRPPARPRGWRRARPRRARSCSPASGRSCAWRACLRDALRDIAKDGKPSFAGPVREAAGRPAARPGLPGQRLRPDHVPPDDRRDLHAARRHPGRRSSPARPPPTPTPTAHAGTALVLAAGNVASLGPRDVLSKLFVEGKVVVMKANPVNDYLVPHWRRALAALIDAGVLRIVDGGAAVGQYLTGHARIDEVHITGSDKTYDAVVFGTGAEGARRKAGRRARAGQAGDGRARQRLAGDRRAGQVVDRRAALPGRARRDHAGEQRRLQLRLGPRRRDARRLAPARGVPRCADADAGRASPRAAPTTRAPPTGGTPSSPPTPRPRSTAAGPTTRCRGRSSAACPPGRPATSASTWSRSSGRWPRRP